MPVAILSQNCLTHPKLLRINREEYKCYDTKEFNYKGGSNNENLSFISKKIAINENKPNLSFITIRKRPKSSYYSRKFYNTSKEYAVKEKVNPSRIQTFEYGVYNNINTSFQKMYGNVYQRTTKKRPTHTHSLAYATSSINKSYENKYSIPLKSKNRINESIEYQKHTDKLMQSKKVNAKEIAETLKQKIALIENEERVSM